MNSEWKNLRLGSFCDVIAGGTPPRSNSAYYGGPIPWVKISDMLQGEITDTDEKITEEALANCNTKLLPAGTILLSIFATIGRSAVLRVPATTNQAIVGIIPRKDDIDKLYFRHFLDAASTSLASKGRGVAQNNINSSILRDLEIPIPHKNGKPDLAEQKQIAAILDKADAIRRKLQQSLRLSDDFLRSVFLDMFGDPEGQGWESTTVEELASEKKGSIRTGPFGSQLLHSEFVDEGIAVLGIDNAVRNKFAWGQPRFITEEKYEDLKRYTVHPGDVLITIMGTCGRCAIVPPDIPKAINTKHLCCITLDPKKCLPEFLHSYFLLHPMAKSYLGQSAKGAIMDGLNGGLIKSLPVPIVPIALQRKYAQLVKSRTRLADRLTTQAIESEALFSSLQQRAFRAEL
jgi:type I restriction enzyme, S subunit